MIRFDRVQAALVSVFSDALASSRLAFDAEVYWGTTTATREQLPRDLLMLQVIGGPAPRVRKAAHGTILNPVVSIEIDVDSVTAVGSRYGLLINDFLFSTLSEPGDTLTTIRDRLRNVVNADTLEPVSAVDVGIDGLRLVADHNGALRELQLLGALSSHSVVNSDTCASVTEQDYEALISLSAFSKRQEPWNGAPAITAACYAALQTPAYVEQLTLAGAGILTKGTPSSVPVVVGGRWVSRSSFDVLISTPAAWVTDVENIENVAATVVVGNITTQQTITP